MEMTKGILFNLMQLFHLIYRISADLQLFVLAFTTLKKFLVRNVTIYENSRMFVYEIIRKITINNK
jgi:hypothetical protein